MVSRRQGLRVHHPGQRPAGLLRSSLGPSGRRPRGTDPGRSSRIRPGARPEGAGGGERHPGRQLTPDVDLAGLELNGIFARMLGVWYPMGYVVAALDARAGVAAVEALLAA